MNYKKVRTVLLRVLILNWIVAILKLTIGVLSGSIAIMADGIHSFFDGASNIVGLIGIHYASRPKDEAHPYGYTKYEALAALWVAGFILLGAYEMGKGILGRIINPTTPTISFLFLGILGIALASDAIAGFYEYRWGKKLQSKLLVADARHTLTHLLTTSSVAVGSVGIMMGFSILDVIIASFVWFMMVRLVWVIFNDVRGVLTDSAALDPKEVQKVVEKIRGVRASHDIRSRGDRHEKFVDLHIVLDPKLSLEEAHRVSHDAREMVMKEIRGVSDVVIHIEPEKKT